jgi:ribosomal protein S12 methylthiotransferase
VLQIEVLVDGHTEDGEIFGRTQWDAPDIDPIVFLAAPEEGLPALEVGQMRRCRVVGTSIFDLEAVPVA